MPERLSPEDQLVAMSMICYLQGLFTDSPKEMYTRDQILMIFEIVGHDPEIFSPGAMDIVKEEIAHED